METTDSANNEIVVKDDDIIELKKRDDRQVARVSDEADPEDLQQAHENLKNIANRSAHVLDKLFDLAESAEHPRIYEVLATMINSATKANRDFLDVSERKNKRDDEEKESKSPSKGDTHNHIHVSSTAELLKLLEEKKSKEND